jgi:outer membrane lipoprotein-sorting protein
MLHRLMLNLLLIVSFGFGQIGALTHEFSHYSDTASLNQQLSFNQTSQSSSSKDEPSQHKQAPHNQVCEKCISYAELGSAISNGQSAFIATPSVNLVIVSPLLTLSPTKPSTYSARAPPTLA